MRFSIIIIIYFCYALKVKAQQTIFAELTGNPIDLTNWNLTGDAGPGDTEGDPDSDNNELLLSKAEIRTLGTCFYNKPLKLSICNKWSAEFSFRIFDGSSADGLAFCFVKDKPTGQELGANIGIPDNPTGIMVVFDTHDNCGNVLNPELQIRYGDGTKDYDECGLGPTKGELNILRKNEYTRAKIKYEDGNLKVYLDNVLQLEGNYLAEFEGYFGFTSATGASFDNHSIKDVVIYKENNQFQESIAQSFCEGDTLILDAGEEYEQYLWDDGSTDRFFSVTQGGTYRAVAQNACNTVLKNFDIKMQSNPVVKLEDDTLICGEGSLLLDASGGHEKYLWDNGSEDSTRIVDRTGVYWVEVFNYLGCKGSDSIEVIFSELPKPSIFGDSLICKNGSIELDAQPGFLEYFWSNGESNQKTTITEPGIYWVKITDKNGCNGIDSIEVLPTPSKNPFLGKDTAICEATSIPLNPGEFTSYLWNDGSVLPTLEIKTSGIYWVKTIDEYGCDGIDSILIDLNSLPEINLGNDTSFCTQESLVLKPNQEFEEYYWNTGELTNSITIINGGLFWLKVKDLNSCENSDSINVVMLDLPVVDLGKDTAFCDNLINYLKAGEGFKSYLWNNGSTESKIQVKDRGIYWVKVIDDNNCENIDSIEVEINQSPELNLGKDTFLCDETEITLKVTEDYEKFLWSNGTSKSTVNISDKGTIWLKVWDEEGCYQLDTINVDAFLTPKVNLGNDTAICLDNTILLDAYFPGSSYLWNDGSTNPKKTIVNIGSYEVTVMNNCGLVSDKIVVKKDFSCDCPFYFPNAFSPNGDGLNDVFKVDFTCRIEQFNLSIYNRWGERIFTTQNPNDVWLGSNEVNPQSVYIWRITGVMFNENGEYYPVKKMGSLTLVK